MASRIEDYALIGDCETAALVGRDGSIDWLGFPRFDSAACFAALLGTRDHGRWLIAPAADVQRIERRYRPGTLVLETDYYTASGRGTGSSTSCLRARVRLSCQDRRRSSAGTFRWRWISGSVRLRIGRSLGSPRRNMASERSPDRKRCTAALRVRLSGQDLRTVAHFSVAAGERVPFELAWSATHQEEPEPTDPTRSLHETENGGWPGQVAARSGASGVTRSSAR